LASVASSGTEIRIVDETVRREVRFVAIKETIRFEEKQDLQTIKKTEMPNIGA
jgi:hypothetical protein